MEFPLRSRRLRAILRFEQLEDRTTPTAASTEAVNVVTTTPTETATEEAALAAAPGAASVDYLGFGIYRVALTAGTTAANAATYFCTQPNIVAASPDATVQVQSLPVQSQSVPNDPAYSSQWGLQQISAPTAWNTSTGSGNFIVAEIDSGVDYTHPDLAANIWTNPGEVASNSLDDDHDGYLDDLHGWNFVNNTNNPFDDNGHGTHVAGIIGAVGNNGQGVVGVDWSAKIMPLKFLDSTGTGLTSNAIKAMNYAVIKGAKVINMSWGGGPPNAALTAAIGAARQAGDIVVIAAGNAGENIDIDKAYPASYSTAYNNVVTVSATDVNDNLAVFSNYGPNSVTLAAPGVGILSTTPNNTYSVFSGTSMATPYVSGAIALLWSLHPDWNYLQVINKLDNSVDVEPALVGKVQTGGQLDVAALLAGTSASVTSAAGPLVYASSFSGTAITNVSRVRFTFDEPIDPGTFTATAIDSFTGPNGAIFTYYTIVPVAGSNNEQFDVSFAPQTAPGLYTMVIGPGIRDWFGDPMNQNGDGTAGEAISDRYTAVGAIVLPITESHFAGALPKPVADYTMTNSGIIIPDDLLISDVNVTLSIAHSNDSDLIIRLRSPAGKYVTLFANRGGSGNNLSHTTFDDQMGRAIGAKHAVPPFTGSFRPEQPLSSFNGTNAQGKWLLQVYDASAGDIGALTSWMLTISGTLGSNSAEMKMMGFPDVLPTGLNTSGGDVKYLAPTEAQPLPTAFPVLETPHATAFTLPTDESVQRSQSPTNSTVSLAESVLRLDSRSEPDTISLTLFDPLAVA